jgi:hypothetical protein
LGIGFFGDAMQDALLRLLQAVPLPEGDGALGKYRQADHQVLTVLKGLSGRLVGPHRWIEDMAFSQLGRPIHPMGEKLHIIGERLSHDRAEMITLPREVLRPIRRLSFIVRRNRFGR